MSASLEVKIAADTIFEIAGIPVTNSHIALWVVSLILIFIAWKIKRGAKLIPGKLQLVLEMILSFFLEMLREAIGSEKQARKCLPIILTLFLIIFISNQFLLIPLLSQIIIHIASGETELFRPPTSSYSLTIALAITAIGSAQIMAFAISPWNHLNNFIKIKSILKARNIKDIANALLETFIGLMDIIGEFARTLSLSSRLFGNIVADEIVLLIVSSLTYVIAPVPFMIQGIFVGLIHSFIFPLLVIQFMSHTVKSASGHH